MLPSSAQKEQARLRGTTLVSRSQGKNTGTAILGKFRGSSNYGADSSNAKRSALMPFLITVKTDWMRRSLEAATSSIGDSQKMKREEQRYELSGLFTVNESWSMVPIVHSLSCQQRIVLIHPASTVSKLIA